MKVLLTVEFYNPDRGGAQKVVEDIAGHFLKNGHDVTVATTYLRKRKENVIGGVKIRPFKISGNFSNGIKGGKKEIDEYKNLLLNGGFDVIMNYAAQSWHTDLALPLLHKIKAVKILAPVGYSRLKSAKYKKYFCILPEYLKRYDKLVYHSPNYQDKKYGDENGISEKAFVIQNGALKSEFLSEEIGNPRVKIGIATKHMLVDISHHNFAKGHRFAINAFRKMKRQDSTLLIVGNKFTSHGLRSAAHFFLDYIPCFFSSLFNKNIKLTSGEDRKFVISAYKNADLYLNGSMLECAPLVMYESFASKTPFVATDVGNVMDYEKYLKIVGSPGEMAAAANKLLDNETERKTLAEDAYSVWQSSNVMEDLAGEYEKLFTDLYEART